jgi:2-methylcitrate dehydratase PrpD
MHAAAVLAEWSTSLELDAVPADVREAARLHLLDAVGTGLAALALGELPAVREAALELGGPPQATALGIEERLSPGAAALVNGSLMHALDFDDTHEVALVHSSAVVAPAMLAAGEAVGASGADMLAAAIGGYEISSRIGLAAPGALHRRGFHPTSVCGVFAAAAVASRLRGLTAEQTTNALGIAGSQASGLMEFLGTGSQTKPLHAGWAAFAGITAASLAAHGATGPASVLEGRFGLLASHLDSFDAEALTADLGTRWETTRIAFKPYPTCHASHAALDALVATGASAGDVQAIEALVASEVAVELVLEPRERKLRPATPYEAKFSLPYCLAALLVRGELGVAAFTPEAIADERVLDLASRVSYAVVPFPDGNELSGGVRVSTSIGVVEECVLRPRGGAGNPLATEDIHAKFRANAGLALSPDEADALLDALTTLEDRSANDIGALLAIGAPAPAG